MLRSTLYNLFSRQSFDDVRRILELGHEVGLHFDAAHPAVAGAASLEGQIASEIDLLSSVVGRDVRAFSYHQPTADVLARKVTLNHVVNAYELGEEFQYVSDSNRDWRGRDVFAMIDSRKPLQLLLHPIWWVCQDPSVWDCWDSAILQNFTRQQDWLMATEGAYGPKRQLLLVRERSAPAGSAEAAYLAPLTDADSSQLFEWINTRELVVSSAPFRPVHFPDHAAWFRDIRSRKDVVIFGIRRSEDHRLVGTCQLHSIDAATRSAELQIRIGVPSAQGKGIGTAACRALLQYAFNDLDLRRVYLHVFDNNAAARALYAKLGFATEGVDKEAVFIDGQWRDIIRMAIER